MDRQLWGHFITLLASEHAVWGDDCNVFRLLHSVVVDDFPHEPLGRRHQRSPIPFLISPQLPLVFVVWSWFACTAELAICYVQPVYPKIMSGAGEVLLLNVISVNPLLFARFHCLPLCTSLAFDPAGYSPLVDLFTSKSQPQVLGPASIQTTVTEGRLGMPRGVAQGTKPHSAGA